MSEESIENTTRSDTNFALTFIDHDLWSNINFNGHKLIKKNISIPKKEVNIYISYTLSPQLGNLSTNLKLGHCLFPSVKITNNAGSDKCKCTGYVTGFDTRSENFYLQKKALKKMSLLLELIWAHLCMLIVREKIS